MIVMFEVISAPESATAGTKRMLGRHNASVMATLEKVADLGVAIVLKAELIRWYGQERLSRGLWRDIEDKWRDELEEDVPLLVGESDGALILAYGEGVTCSKEAWFQPVSVLASRPAE